MLAVWITLISGVTKINMLSAEKQKKEAEAYTAKQEELSKALVAVTKSYQDITALQTSSLRNVNSARLRRSVAERQLTNTVESLTRVTLQKESALKDSETAKQGLAQRKDEKAGLEQNIATVVAEVTKLQEGNADLLANLQKTREAFKTKLAENQAEVEKQLKGGNTKPAVRNASFSR
jgi:chromosome segregation ATPase